MDQHYDAGIKLDRIAACAFFSKFHFIRVFKSVYGKTPNQYLVSVRIEQAKERLKNGSTIADAGADLAETLIDHKLIDEYRLIVNPIVLGGGKPLFRRRLKLALRQKA